MIYLKTKLLGGMDGGEGRGGEGKEGE